jgi:hypothetical protein
VTAFLGGTPYLQLKSGNQQEEYWDNNDIRSDDRVLRTSILYQCSKDQPSHRNEIDRCKGDDDHICHVEGAAPEIEDRGNSSGISDTGENRGRKKEEIYTHRVHCLFPVPHEVRQGHYRSPQKGTAKDVGGSLIGPEVSVNVV